MNTLPVPVRGKVILLLTHHGMPEPLIELIARSALHDSLSVVDAGNRFNVYPLAIALRRITSDVKGALSRVRVARAFTCYQVHSLLQAQVVMDQPCIVIDLLATFMDEAVRFQERVTLLRSASNELRRIGSSAPLVVTIKPADERLIHVITPIADQIVEVA